MKTAITLVKVLPTVAWLLVGAGCLSRESGPPAETVAEFDSTGRLILDGTQMILDAVGEAVESSAPAKTTQIWLHVRFSSLDGKTDLTFDGNGMAILPGGDRKSPASFGIIRSGLSLRLEIYDETGKPLGRSSIPIEIRGSGAHRATIFEREYDDKWDYHGSINSRHNQEIIEYFASPDGDLLMVKKEHTSGWFSGIHMSGSKTALIRFRPKPNHAPEPMPLKRHGSP